MTADGHLHALQLDLFNNGGFSHDLSIAILDRALFHIDNVYRIPNVKAVGKIAFTHLPSNTAFRGFGGPQGMMICEMIMDDIARNMKIAPEQLRRQNMYRRVGDKTHFGQAIEPFEVPRMWGDLMARSDYDNRRKAVDLFNSHNRYRKRGLCILPTKFGCSFTAKFLNQGGALVLVYKDGSVLVSHGGTEMGQGLHTKMAQIVASCFQIPMAAVYVAETATDKVANASPTAASMSRCVCVCVYVCVCVCVGGGGSVCYSFSWFSFATVLTP